MKLKTLSLAMMSMAVPSMVAADELLVMQQNENNWVMPAGDYANTRYSRLAQITKDNVADLKMAWSFSTGVLRGHEGNALVIDGTMYVHTPFPNIVYALDLNNYGAIKWKYEAKPKLRRNCASYVL
ncbi:methanol dehydrogenase large subunit protein [Methylophaga lonarensis MPL]|uniref:Methanol dehydrogenase large subunit protein n=1 Tax=Methylophaga lonarensis MPL TaxID=1286106 RepID=M7NZK7_9GAMM|nr:methanol dehydrogenase large subunit protein [Methylophaga lonarensis MPL]